MRLPLEVLARMREAVGPDFIIIFRLSMLDLVPEGGSWDEVVELARRVARGGATLINTGIGWHEARIPTIATTSVPRAGVCLGHGQAARAVAGPVKASTPSSPATASTPRGRRSMLADGSADMVSMARPSWPTLTSCASRASGGADEINTCIACNQACLDHAFARRRLPPAWSTPRGARATEIVLRPVRHAEAHRRGGRRASGPRLPPHAG